jgi:hypothetical protein
MIEKKIHQRDYQFITVSLYRVTEPESVSHANNHPTNPYPTKLLQNNQPSFPYPYEIYSSKKDVTYSYT